MAVKCDFKMYVAFNAKADGSAKSVRTDEFGAPIMAKSNKDLITRLGGADKVKDDLDIKGLLHVFVDKGEQARITIRRMHVDLDVYKSLNG